MFANSSFFVIHTFGFDGDGTESGRANRLYSRLFRGESGGGDGS